MSSYLEEQISSQQAQHASVTDTHQWLTRVIFVPFRDRDLSLKLQGDFGVVGSLRAGFLIPITRRQQYIMDYDEVKRVPTYSDGTYHPSSAGVSIMKPVDRAPSKVVAAILRIFNLEHGDATHDNGIWEVEELLGNDDMDVLRELNAYCLPEQFNVARLQIAQLEKAVNDAPTELHRSVATRLLNSTQQSVVWANWHYFNLEAQMEQREKTGKDNLSPLDEAVCKWIEKPRPTFRSNLSNVAQPVIMQGMQAPVLPTIQCEGCGNVSNLLANNQPPKFCGICREPFAVKVEAVEDSSSLEMTFSADNPMAETEAEKTARLKAEHEQTKERLKSQKDKTK